MNCRAMFVFLFLAPPCSACDSSLKALFEPSPFDASNGQLTINEIQYFASKMQESLGDAVTECLTEEATVRASKTGDPEKLDPNKVELLPVDQWGTLDKSGKRPILTQVIINQAIPLCTQGKSK